MSAMTFPFEVHLDTESSPPETSLYESKECQIVQSEAERKMILLDRWSTKTASLASEFDVHALLVSEGFGWTGETLSFLRKVTGLRSLTVSTSHQIDWDDLLHLDKLQRLSLFANVAPCGSLDFSAFKMLKECRLTFWENWRSILEHQTVETLYLKGATRRELVFELPQMTCLQLVDGPKIANFGGDAMGKLKGLQISRCKKLKPSWPEIAALEALRLDGPCGFDLEELTLIKNLKRFYLYDYGRVTSVQFIKKMPKLRLFRVGWHTTLEKHNWDTLRALPRLQL
jgi:hypothetical protein